MISPLLSCAMIVRDEPPEQLARALSSIRPLVDELVVLDTGSSSPAKPELVDVFDVYGGCNGKDGQMLDFAAARNESFSRCSGDFVVWLDADDVVQAPGGAPAPPDVLRKACIPRTAVYFPYQYDERIRFQTVRVVPRGTLWAQPIHEFLRELPEGQMRWDVEWVHVRAGEASLKSALRNLRICDYWRSHPAYKNDSRFLFNLGQSYWDLAIRTTAIEHVRYKAKALGAYTRAYEHPAGWIDLQFVAAVRCANMVLPDHDKYLSWAWNAVKARPDWPAGHFLVGKAYYHLSERHFHSGNGAKSLQCAKWSVQAFEQGLRLPPEETELWIENERNVTVPRFLSGMLHRVGHSAEAVAVCQRAMSFAREPEIRAELLGAINMYRAAVRAACETDSPLPPICN